MPKSGSLECIRNMVWTWQRISFVCVPVLHIRTECVLLFLYPFRTDPQSGSFLRPIFARWLFNLQWPVISPVIMRRLFLANCVSWFVILSFVVWRKILVCSHPLNALHTSCVCLFSHLLVCFLINVRFIARNGSGPYTSSAVAYFAIISDILCP